MKRHCTSIFYSLLALIVVSCGPSSDQKLLSQAEYQVTHKADSCLIMLDSIQMDNLSGKDAALADMLRAWALYRQYEKVIPVEPLDNAALYFAESSDPLRRAQFYYLYSVVREDQKVGNQKEWLEDMYKACLAAQEIEDHILAGQIYQRYEHKLYESHQYKESIIWAQRYYEESVAGDRHFDQILALTNLSLSQVMQAQEEAKKRINYDGQDMKVLADAIEWEPAFATLYKALELAVDYKLTSQEGKVCSNLASYYSDRLMPDSALYYALRAKDIQEQLRADGKISAPINYLSLAECYRRLGKTDSCIYYAKRTLECDGLFTRRNAANLLVQAYNDKKDYESQTYWMHIHQQYQDTIHQQIEAQQVGSTEAAVIKEAEKAKLRQRNSYTLHWAIGAVLVFIILVIFLIRKMIRNRRIFRIQYTRQEAEINQLITEMQQMKNSNKTENKTEETGDEPTENIPHTEASAPEEPAAAPAKLALTGSTKDQLNIDPEAILFLTSESNYIKVLYVNAEGKVHSKMLRQTMSRIEEILAPCSYIVRCHRAFFINLHHVTHASSVPTGLILSLDLSNEEIPVSRTYISIIKQRLSE